MRVDSSPAWKRGRFTAVSSMEFESAKARIAAARDKYGREIRVFETSTASASTTDSMEETDEFYEFTSEDYYRLMSSKKEEKHLKTKKLRDAEVAASRSKMTKATIRVRFPDNHTLEASFHPSETVQSLVELLKKAVLHPELPFYLYTTPPKKVIKDFSQDFYSAAFVPGAILYFMYNLPNGGGDDCAITAGPFLQEDLMCLKGLELMVQVEDNEAQPSTELAEPAATTANGSAIPEQKRVDKKMKPKWLKM